MASLLPLIKSRAMLLAGTLSLFTGSISPASAQETTATIRIDAAKRFQTLSGFGASGAWWTNYVADFPDDERDRMLRLLFTKDGADLSIYRYNLPAGDGADVTDRLRRTVLVETSPGKYDFERDWKARKILSEVRALGVE